MSSSWRVCETEAMVVVEKVVSLVPHWTLTVSLLYPHCTPTVPSLYPHCTLTVLQLYPHCTQTIVNPDKYAWERVSTWSPHNRIETVSSLRDVTSGIFKFSLRGNSMRWNRGTTYFLKLLNGNETYLIKIIGTLKFGIKRQYMGKITLYRKKKNIRQQLTAFQKQYILNIPLKFLTYIRLYKVTQNWRHLILFATMFTNSIDELRIISIVTSNPGSNHQPNYHNIALCQTLFSSFVHHVLVQKDRHVNNTGVLSVFQ